MGKCHGVQIRSLWLCGISCLRILELVLDDIPLFKYFCPGSCDMLPSVRVSDNLALQCRFLAILRYIRR
jgi:hypothetical protein